MRLNRSVSKEEAERFPRFTAWGISGIESVMSACTVPTNRRNEKTTTGILGFSPNLSLLLNGLPG
jgi:hypothetical protein